MHALQDDRLDDRLVSLLPSPSSRSTCARYSCRRLLTEPRHCTTLWHCTTITPCDRRTTDTLTTKPCLLPLSQGFALASQQRYYSQQDPPLGPTPSLYKTQRKCQSSTPSKSPPGKFKVEGPTRFTWRSLRSALCHPLCQTLVITRATPTCAGCLFRHTLQTIRWTTFGTCSALFARVISERQGASIEESRNCLIRDCPNKNV